MAEIRVRNVHPHVKQRLDEIAKNKSISREELLRKILERYTITDLLEEQESKFESKMNSLMELNIKLNQKVDVIINEMQEEE